MTVPVADPLAPVRAALLAAAQQDAERVLSAARSKSDAVLARAAQERERLLADARARGEADAGRLLDAERARTRRQARTMVLRAQGQAYEDLRRRAVGAVSALRDDPAYPALLDRLRRQARALVGPDAQVLEPSEGGVVAEAAGRLVVLTLPALAEQVLDRGLPDLEGLWNS